jgi:hypothetical protein
MTLISLDTNTYLSCHLSLHEQNCYKKGTSWLKERQAKRGAKRKAKREHKREQKRVTVNGPIIDNSC